MGAPKLRTIFDEQLQEDIAWRVMFLQMHLGGADLKSLALPELAEVGYKPLPGDDHDHCLGCWRKFMENGGPETDNSCWSDNPDTRQADIMLCGDCNRIRVDIRAGRIKVTET